MQEVRDPTTSGESGPVSPVKAFLILGAVVVVTIGIVIATRPDPPQATDRPTSTAVPTQAEAIAIFKNLNETRIQAYEERDVSLLSRVFSTGSSIQKRATNEIRQLRRDEVVAQTLFTNEEIEVVSVGRQQLVLIQSVTVDARFYSEEGDDLTQDQAPQRQRIRWTLNASSGEWLITRGEVLEAGVQ